MAVTIKDIARLCGVSTATVSKVMNGKDHDVSKKTIEKVKRIAEQQNYTPSGLARSLVTKQTKTVGLIIPDVRNPFFTDLVRGAEDVAHKHGYSLFCCNTDDNLDKELKYIRTLIEKRVDGIALSGSIYRNKQKEEKFHFQMPVVSLDRNVFFKGIQAHIEVDNLSGAFQAVDYLIKNGHQRILFLSGDLDIKPSQERLKGYKNALEKNNIAFDESLVIKGEFNSNFGYNAIAQISMGDITAVFCGNDMIALGAMNALREKGLDIPKHVSVVGFDDIFFAPLLTPKLTSVKQPSYTIGYSAVETLIHIIEKKEDKNLKSKIQTRLIVRDSTGPVT